MYTDGAAHCATACNVIGLYLAGSKHRYSHLFSLSAQAFWCIYSLHTANIPLVPSSVIFTVFAIWNHRKWNKEHKAVQHSKLLDDLLAVSHKELKI